MCSATVHPPIVKTVLWRTESDTQAFARALAGSAALRNAFIELRGDLGAGKTTLVRHLLRALGVTGRVKSPTYAVVEPYELPGLAIWHFDFYRFSDPREWVDAGFRDIFASPGLKLAEWPQQTAGCLPLADLVLTLELLDDGARRVTLRAQSAAGLALSQSFIHDFDSTSGAIEKGKGVFLPQANEAQP
ncbi:MAG: tRNA (adenosine(37)-N6)-threonylcarbamoyltransferase complex ATPase subunit type 1 TsaE [Rhodoferax sp.]|nr:tRNA (adenosine(37)-N6)-threonylcarbamoyltransferase complex ATPase subunit type 1 TsaE [Rhodoferax sp.]